MGTETKQIGPITCDQAVRLAAVKVREARLDDRQCDAVALYLNGK
jgi:hypothetical protein